MSEKHQATQDRRTPTRSESFEVAGWHVDVAGLRLLRGETEMKLGGRAMDLLLHLVERPDEVVSRGELLDVVWGEKAVTEEVVTVAVHELRRAFEDDPRDPRVIATVKGRGYRWLASGRPTEYPPPATPEIVPEAPALAAPRRLGRSWWMASAAALAVLLVLALWTSKVDRGVESDPVTSLAVLPLRDTSMDADPEARWADGLTEMLIDELARRGPERVIARTSVMRYRDNPQPAGEIAAELGVDVLVEGSLLRRGDQMRLTVSLIDGTSERRRWTESFQASRGEVLALPVRVARHVALELGFVSAATNTKEQLVEQGHLPAAVDAYIEGRAAHAELTHAGLEKALERFETALSFEEDFALAHSGRASTAWLLAARGRREMVQVARDSVERALTLDPRLADAYVDRAVIAMLLDRDLEAATQDFRRALELHPSHAKAHDLYAWLLLARGRYDEAVAHARQALVLDPRSHTRHGVLASILLYAGEPERALEAFAAQRRHLMPHSVDLWAEVAAHWAVGDLESALRVLSELENALGLESGASDEGSAGFEPSLRRLLRTEIPKWPGLVSEARGMLGDSEGCLDALEALAASGHPGLLWARSHPAYRQVQGNPRFLAILSASQSVSLQSRS